MLSAGDLIENMAIEMGLLPAHLYPIIRTAPLRYKVFFIPKRTGGLREVAQPAREVKAIQRWVVERLLNKLPVHSAATAYRLGSSIEENANRHLGSNYILKLDFKSFFPSIQMKDIQSHVEKHLSGELDTSAARLAAYVCTWARERQPPLRLCIGAPSSPIISNSIMFDFDCRLANLSGADGVVYTRYADDVTLSCKQKGKLAQYVDVISDLIDQMAYPRIALNTQKTVFASRAGRRTVTGINLTPVHQLSVGRERKRLIRAMCHRRRLGQLSPEDEQKLGGLIAFVESIEPGFAAKLSRTNGG